MAHSQQRRYNEGKEQGTKKVATVAHGKEDTRARRKAGAKPRKCGQAERVVVEEDAKLGRDAVMFNADP